MKRKARKFLHLRAILLGLTSLSMWQFQQAIMGCYSTYCVECAFAYSWKGSSFICYWKLHSFCGGSTKGRASSCWCMNLLHHFDFKLFIYCFSYDSKDHMVADENVYSVKIRWRDYHFFILLHADIISAIGAMLGCG